MIELNGLWSINRRLVGGDWIYCEGIQVHTTKQTETVLSIVKLHSMVDQIRSGNYKLRSCLIAAAEGWRQAGRVTG